MHSVSSIASALLGLQIVFGCFCCFTEAAAQIIPAACDPNTQGLSGSQFSSLPDTHDPPHAQDASVPANHCQDGCFLGSDIGSSVFFNTLLASSAPASSWSDPISQDNSAQKPSFGETVSLANHIHSVVLRE